MSTYLKAPVTATGWLFCAKNLDIKRLLKAIPYRQVFFYGKCFLCMQEKMILFLTIAVNIIR